MNCVFVAYGVLTQFQHQHRWAYQRGCSTSSRVSTEMGDGDRCGYTVMAFNQANSAWPSLHG